MEYASTEEIKLILMMIAKGYKVPEIIYNTIFDVAKREIEEKHKVVIYKRDPDTGARRIQGAYVKVITGDTIEIHPVAVGGFGADFDGDTMGLYAPISDESQQEVRDKMVTVYDNYTINAPNFELSKEMLTGLFTLTYTRNEKSIVKSINNVEEAKKLDIGQLVSITTKGQKVKTTAGRVIFNDAIPTYVPFIDEEITKGKAGKLLKAILDKSQGDFAQTIDKFMKLGFYYATVYPKTVSLDLLKINPTLMKLKMKLGQAKEITEQMAIIDEMEKELVIYLKSSHSDIYDMVQSGGAKGKDQIRQMMICKGLISDAMGNTLPPILASFNDGYDPQSYFEASAGARKGTIDRSLNTAVGGYTYRKMIFIVGNVEANINNGNCGTTRTLDIKLTKELFDRMPGRYVLENNVIKPIRKEMIGEVIKLRSPIFCKTTKICRICYGDLIYQLKTPNVGIVAAQQVGSLAEKIMKCTSGTVQYKDGLISFSDLWELAGEVKQSKDGYEQKVFNNQIMGKNGLVETYSIEKHIPKKKVLFITTKNGYNIICQEDHPCLVKESSIHPGYKNADCKLVSDGIYNIGAKLFKITTTDSKQKIKEAGNFIKC